MIMRNIYLHCGLHKTGSTAVQLALSARRESALLQGLLYPLTGRVGGSGGHHNIAWQLSGDRRFDRRAGDVDALFGEIAGHDGDAVLSSEDFESSLNHMQHWDAFIARAAQLSYRIVFIIYLRNPLSYIESLYCEMLRHGFGDAFEIYVENALSTGRLRIEDWEFNFDFAAFLEPLIQRGDVDVICRNYHSLLHRDAVFDMFSVLGLRCNEQSETRGRANNRDDLSVSLELFYTNRVRRMLLPVEKTIIELIAKNNHLEVRTSGSLKRRIIHRYNESTFNACKAGRLEFDASLMPESAIIKHVPISSMQQVFSSRTQQFVQDIAAEIPVHLAHQVNDRQKESCMHMVAQWAASEKS